MGEIRGSATAELRGKRAINAALELFHRRWTMRILWELRDDALNFRDLQIACGDLSPSVLNVRLAELREALLVGHEPGEGYGLTAQGRSLMKAIAPLLRWAPQWADEVDKAATRAATHTRPSHR